DHGGYIGIDHLNTGNVMDHIPGQVYRFRFIETQHSAEIKLIKDRKQFDLPEKIYGDNPKHMEMIVAAHNRRPGSTGALFVGEKGAGKSLLAEMIANRFIKQDWPVLFVDSKIPVDVLRMTLK